MKVYIEIEKGSNVKYELNKETGCLEVDRILSAPFVYPYAYGFIPDTLAADGDELDALIICEEPLHNDRIYDAHIVCALRMEDEKGMDEKVICTLDGADVSTVDLEKIEQFFATYKTGCDGKWSKTAGFMSKEEAIVLSKLASKGKKSSRDI